MNLILKNEIKKIEKEINEVNNHLNQLIADYSEIKYDIDRERLRAIRDENIKTILLIQKMELVGLI